MVVEPGYTEFWNSRYTDYAAGRISYEECRSLPQNRRPRRYCHGDRHESPFAVTHENAAGCLCEWVYCFDEAQKTMAVLRPRFPEGVTWANVEGPEVTWYPVAVISLDGPEPGWEEIEMVVVHPEGSAGEEE